MFFQLKPIPILFFHLKPIPILLLQLKLCHYEEKTAKDKVEKLSTDLSKRDRQLSMNIAQAIANGDIETVLYSESAQSAKEVLAEADYKVRCLQQKLDDHKFDTQVRDEYSCLKHYDFLTLNLSKPHSKDSCLVVSSHAIMSTLYNLSLFCGSQFLYKILRSFCDKMLEDNLLSTPL